MLANAEMRWRGSAGLYWIDGVCIDQSNPAERSEQVAFMGEIYREADRVVVWLGTDEGNDRKTFEMIEDLNGGRAMDIRTRLSNHVRKIRFFQDPDQYFATESRCGGNTDILFSTCILCLILVPETLDSPIGRSCKELMVYM